MPARRLAGPAGAALAVGLLVAGCGSSSATPVPASAPPSAVAPSPALASPVTGVVVSVDSAGLSKVTGFTLRLPDGTQQAFRIGVLENGAEFPPGHLQEHALTAAPVRVSFRREGADLVVYRIEDAG
jgi:hypothetical protein